MFRFLVSARQRLRDPSVRELFAWCLPALLLGLLLRAVLMAQMPYAYYHDDTPDFLTTADHLLSDHHWVLHPKKTWLVPAVFTVPFLLHVPALIAIPVLQHLLGLVQVVLIGWLCRLWFRKWKWFIIPLTAVAAANPFFLWYEHTLMAESLYLFCTVLLALAGTLYAIEQTRGRFVLLCAALFLEAGARPEGKLLFGFAALLLVLLHFRERRNQWRRLAILLALGLATHFMTKTSQAGLLLYTSVTRLTPTKLHCAPGFDRYIAGMRSDLQQRWREELAFPKARDRKAISGIVGDYLKENPTKLKNSGRRGVNEFCLRLAKETCLRNLPLLPGLTYYKFRATATESPSGLFDNNWLFDRQRSAYATGDESTDAYTRALRLSHGLAGQSFNSTDDINRFIDAHYGEAPWFNRLVDAWLKAVNAVHLPDRQIASANRVGVMPGLPVYFVVAMLGILAVMLQRGALQPFHIAWGLTLLAFFFVIILTANTKPRFRFVFEPFWFLYVGLLIDVAASSFIRSRSSVSEVAKEQPALSQP